MHADLARCERYVDAERTQWKARSGHSPDSEHRLDADPIERRAETHIYRPGSALDSEESHQSSRTGTNQRPIILEAVFQINWSVFLSIIYSY